MKMLAAIALMLIGTPAIADGAPGPFHGNWRMTAADDQGDHAVMALAIQLSRAENTGTGSYFSHQPMCDFLLGGAIRGDLECELGGGAFVEVTRKGRRLTLVLHPTADGQPHRMVLRRSGERLVGTYLTTFGFARLVILEPAP